MIPRNSRFRSKMSINTNFHFESRKEGKVTICLDNKPVTYLKGARVAKFLAKTSGKDHDAQQLVMAKTTRNFKRGNERRGK